jgi:hypothetical protein
LGVEGFGPAAEKKLEVVFDMIKTPDALSFQMVKHGLGLVDHLPASGASPQAKVDVFNPIAIGLVEASQLQKKIAANQ